MSYKFKFEFECLDRGRVKGNRIELAKNILILGQIILLILPPSQFKRTISVKWMAIRKGN